MVPVSVVRGLSVGLGLGGPLKMERGEGKGREGRGRERITYRIRKSYALHREKNATSVHSSTMARPAGEGRGEDREKRTHTLALSPTARERQVYFARVPVKHAKTRTTLHCSSMSIHRLYQRLVDNRRIPRISLLARNSPNQIKNTSSMNRQIRRAGKQ